MTKTSVKLLWLIVTGGFMMPTYAMEMEMQEMGPATGEVTMLLEKEEKKGSEKKDRFEEGIQAAFKILPEPASERVKQEIEKYKNKCSTTTEGEVQFVTLFRQVRAFTKLVDKWRRSAVECASVPRTSLQRTAKQIEDLEAANFELQRKVYKERSCKKIYRNICFCGLAGWGVLAGFFILYFNGKLC